MQEKIFLAILHSLFPIYAMRQRKTFIQYCAQRVSAMSCSPEHVLPALLRYLDLQVIVVDTHTSSLYQVYTASATTYPLQLRADPVIKNVETRLTKSDINRTTQTDRRLKQELKNRQKKSRLRQFLRTGFRASVTKNTEDVTYATLEQIKGLRNEPGSCSWARLSAWHRVQALRRYMDTDTSTKKDDDPKYVALIQSILHQCGDVQIQNICNLPPPEFDRKTGRVVRLVPVTSVRRTGSTPTSVRVKRNHKWKQTLRQCRTARIHHNRKINQTVQFTGDFVRTN